MLSKSSRLWKERPSPAAARRRGDQRLITCPSSVIVPDAVVTNPVMASINVVLPAPFGPIRPVTSPGRNDSDTPLSAATPPKRTETSSTSSVIAGTMGRSASGSGSTSRPRTSRCSTRARSHGIGRLRRRRLASPLGMRSSTRMSTTPRMMRTTSSLTTSPIDSLTMADGARLAPSTDPKMKPMPPMTA